MNYIRDNENHHYDVFDVPATIAAIPAAIMEVIVLAEYGGADKW